MSPFVFLGIAVAVSVVGFVALWMRHREPQSMEARMREFARELDALAPEGRRHTDPASPPFPEDRGRRSG